MAKASRKEKHRANQGAALRRNKLVVKPIELLTPTQQSAAAEWYECYNLSLLGMPGTGKTFLAFFFALSEVLNGPEEYHKVVLIRSTVPTREIGILPGDLKEKIAGYEEPYANICNEILGRGDAYQLLKQKGIVEFKPTAFLRGITLDDSIIIVDEPQNMSAMELHTIMTRVGNNSRIIFCGDTAQDDLTSKRYNEESGLREFMHILHQMDEFAMIEFGIDDIVRSGLVKSYIIARDRLGL